MVSDSACFHVTTDPDDRRTVGKARTRHARLGHTPSVRDLDHEMVDATPQMMQVTALADRGAHRIGIDLVSADHDRAVLMLNDLAALGAPQRVQRAVVNVDAGREERDRSAARLMIDAHDGTFLSSSPKPPVALPVRAAPDTRTASQRMSSLHDEFVSRLVNRPPTALRART